MIKVVIFDCFGVLLLSGGRKNAELLEEIKNLREEFRTGIISNVGAGFWFYFDESEIAEYFDDVVLSYQVGLIKPDLRIFELAAERLEAKPSECVFIDNDEENVRAAEKCGMRGVVYEMGMEIKPLLML